MAFSLPRATKTQWILQAHNDRLNHKILMTGHKTLSVFSYAFLVKPNDVKLKRRVIHGVENAWDDFFISQFQQEVDRIPLSSTRSFDISFFFHFFKVRMKVFKKYRWILTSNSANRVECQRTCSRNHFPEKNLISVVICDNWTTFHFV